MAVLQPIIAQFGPLPITTTATIETDSPVILSIAGSVWTSSENCMIGIGLEVDGGAVAKAPIYSNGPGTHRTVVPLMIPVTFEIGEHTFALGPLTPQTESDSNDYYAVSLQY